MQRTTFASMIAALAAGAVFAAGPVAAQGRGHAYGRDKDKDRGGWNDDRDRRDNDKRDRDWDRDRDDRDDRDDRNSASRGRAGARPSRDDYCLDRNHDYTCDAAQRRGSTAQQQTCVDRNRDGYCDTSSNGTYYPSSPGSVTERASRPLPSMQAGVTFVTFGVRTAEMRQWVGSDVTRAVARDSNGDGRRDAIDWLAGSTLQQRWIDRNGDGRADRIEYYSNGRLYRAVE